MTLFDLVVLGLLILSGLVGFIRGATRELITVIAFVLGALAAVFALRFTGPIARDAINPSWAGNAVAILIVFLIVYILLRVLGATITKRIHQTSALGSIDRAAGVGVGLIRALVLIGVFHLVFHAATPPERLPRWMTGAASYPLSGAAAGALRVVAREGAENADSLGPALKDAVATDGAEPQPGEAAAETERPPAQERRR
ncbi:MAG TPA: CvpA family protein [Caulobacteraceae bacterium]